MSIFVKTLCTNFFEDAKMLITEALQTIQEHVNRPISQTEIAQILGTTSVAINKRITRSSELKVSEAIKLVNHYGYNLFNDFIQNDNLLPNSPQNRQDSVEIVYYENPTLDKTIKNPLITSLWLDRELVRDIWKKDETNLRTIKMPGDVMNGGERPIKNRDMLIIDLSSTDILSSGIYAYTTNDDNFIFINGIKQKVDGSVKFYYWNKTYSEAVYKLDDLKKINFKVIGRVIKNMTALI